jgi:hypothetical protein
MPFTAQIEHVKSFSGVNCGPRKFRDFVSLKDTMSAPVVYQPWTQTATKAVIAGHNLAAFNNLQITFAPGPGFFGRVVQLSWCWKHDGQEKPTSISQMATLAGFETITFGGVSAAPGSPIVRSPVFDDSITDALKMRNMAVGGKFEMVYLMTCAKFGNEQGVGDILDIVIVGEYEVFGNA